MGSTHWTSRFWQQCMISQLHGGKSAKRAISDADKAVEAFDERFRARLEREQREEDKLYGFPDDDDDGGVVRLRPRKQDA